MGCDIHLIHQVRSGPDAPWVTVPDLPRHDLGDGDHVLDAAPDDRRYGVFACLAGVRNRDGVTPVAEPRGIPDDLYLGPLADFYLGDHSFSWLTLDEIAIYAMNHPPTDQTGSHAALHGWYHEWAQDFTLCGSVAHSDVRLVFGFDN